jgi:hypothetical protein
MSKNKEIITVALNTNTNNGLFKTFIEHLYRINSSVYFSGIMMLMLNIGSKYITIDLSKNQEQLLKNNIMRQVLIFSIIWIGTKDILVSLGLTAVFVILADYLFNEESSFCVIPDYMKRIEKAMDLTNDNKVSELEIKRAMKILEKAKQDNHKANQGKLLEMFSNNDY